MYRIGQEEIDAVAKVINAGSLFKVNDKTKLYEHCEAKLKSMFDSPYSIFMSSGYGALESALVGMGIGPGDEVIVPAYTYIATAMAVVGVGAIPVIVESDDSLTLDPADFEAHITKNTKAVMPVHIQGYPCKMDEICAIAKKHGIKVLEDACQSVGASYKGKKLGTIGDAGALSFNFFKVISAGEGGALFTNDKQIFERAVIYHDSCAIAFFGNQMENFSTSVFCGKEYRTNEISAAIMSEQLNRLDGIIADLRKNKAAIRDMVKDYVTLVPVNDIEGDTSTTIAFTFNTEAEAREFAGKCGGWLPIDTGKHVYKNWTPIMEKCGAVHPLMDPFKMEANKDIIPNYTEDMCPKTLDYLSRAVYIAINPDWTEAEVKAKADAIIAAAK